MKRFVGLDVSQKSCAICILEDDGKKLFEGDCATDPDTILESVFARAGAVDRIVHESGPLSIWLSRELDKRGAPVVCIDARAAHKALSARMNKSDRSDAEALAQLARTGWYREVHIKSEESDRLRLLLSARERLVKVRMDIEAQARGILKTFGIRLGSVRAGRCRRDFRDQLSEVVSGDPILEVVFASLITVHETVCQEATDLDAEIQAFAKDSPLARRLTSVPGVGPIVALSFIATIDDASRFRRAVDVGAYLGLVPRRYQSGEIDYTGSISKCGDRRVRTLLYEAANVMLTRYKGTLKLKDWALAIAARSTMRKARIALARRLAIILHAMLRDGTEFRFA